MKMDEPQDRVWRKASASGINGCVEVATGASGAVKIRDSKNPRGIMLNCSRSAWLTFLSASKGGEFDALTRAD
jgi:streptogramin lyase